MRATVITGNWKMYKTTKEAVDFVNELAPKILVNGVTVCLSVPFTIIQAAADAAKRTSLIIGAQNMSDAQEGAFTGEISSSMLKDVGARFVLLGHSERRHVFGEDNSFINRKVKQALKDGIRPVLCIGETLEQREQGKTEDVLKSQLTECLSDVTPEQLATMWVAYEPVWAIGTGKTATPIEAQATHRFCRAFISQKWGKKVADELVIQYGGSVKPDNIKELIQQPDIDGVLVGGASLNVKAFEQIVASAQENYQTIQ